MLGFIKYTIFKTNNEVIYYYTIIHLKLVIIFIA